jgi:hypothetical protein
MIVAPFFINCKAVSFPIPVFAPVIITMQFSKLRVTGHFGPLKKRFIKKRLPKAFCNKMKKSYLLTC